MKTLPGNMNSDAVEERIKGLKIVRWSVVWLGANIV
jgi:hypothetical protein